MGELVLGAGARKRITVGLFMLLVASCSDERDVVTLDYGGGHPGFALAEGGEIRHENVRMHGMPEQTWIHVYQFTGPSVQDNAPFAVPPDNGQGLHGSCIDQRTSQTWPFRPISGATYLELPKVEITGPGIVGALTLPEAEPPSTVGNSTFRTYELTYGGGAPGNPPSGFNGTLSAEESMPGGEYTLDIGRSEPMTYRIPQSYAAPLGIGGADTIMIASGEDLAFSWVAPPNELGESNSWGMLEHTRNTYINFTLFVAPTVEPFAVQFICFPDADGHQTVPASVIDVLPKKGLVIHANMNHYMYYANAPIEPRRFDLVSTYLNISRYSLY